MPAVHKVGELGAFDKSDFAVGRMLDAVGPNQVLVVDMGGGRLLPQEIKTGSVAGDYTEVLAGLEPGQRVVTSAQFLLDSESNLAEVMRAMMGQMSSGDVKKMQDMPGMDMPAPSTPRR